MKRTDDKPSNAELLTEAVLDDMLTIEVYATDPEERDPELMGDDRFMAAAALENQVYARSGEDPQTAIGNLLATICNDLREESS